MLKKSQRLTREEFDHLMEKNRTVRSGALVMRFRTLDSADTPSKFSVVISKKVAKMAIMRHLYKRRVYAVLRDKRTNLKPRFYASLFIQKGFSDLKSTDIQKLVHQLLSEAGIL